MTDLSAAPERDIEFRSRAYVLAQLIHRRTMELYSTSLALDSISNLDAFTFTVDLPIAFTAPMGLPAFPLRVRIMTIGAGGEGVIAAAAMAYPEIRLFAMLPLDWTRTIFEALHGNPRAQAELEYNREQLEHYFAHIDNIVHELIHVFDHARGLYAVAHRREAPRTREEYINSDVEFNAHFQQILIQTESTLRGMPRVVLEVVALDFHAFYRFVEQQPIAREFIPYLRGKWLKKFKSRIYQTWDHLREQVAAEKKP